MTGAPDASGRCSPAQTDGAVVRQASVSSAFWKRPAWRLLGLRQGLEPVGDLVEAFLAGGARHARIHVGVFVRLAGDRGLQVVGGAADRQAGGRIADFFEKFEMAVRMAGLAFGGRAEHGGDVVVAFDIGLLREIQIAAVGLALAGKRGLQIVLGLRTLQTMPCFFSILQRTGWLQRIAEACRLLRSAANADRAMYRSWQNSKSTVFRTNC